MSDFDWNNKNSAPIGTPENPEIIEPGEPSRNERDVGGNQGGSRRRFTFRSRFSRGGPAGFGTTSEAGETGANVNPFESLGKNAGMKAPTSGGRIRRGVQILMWMVYISAPALLFDSIWFWLYEMGQKDGGFFAWFLLILISPPAFLLTVVAMVINSFLLLIFFANLIGRPIAENPAGFIRFIKIR